MNFSSSYTIFRRTRVRERESEGDECNVTVRWKGATGEGGDCLQSIGKG